MLRQVETSLVCLLSCPGRTVAARSASYASSVKTAKSVKATELRWTFCTRWMRFVYTIATIMGNSRLGNWCSPGAEGRGPAQQAGAALVGQPQQQPAAVARVAQHALQEACVALDDRAQRHQQHLQ